MIRMTSFLVISIVCFGFQPTLHKTDFSIEEDTRMVKEILALFDDHTIDFETKIAVHVEDLVHMAQGHKAVTNQQDLLKAWKEEAKWGHSEMTHHLISIHSYDDMVLTRGKAIGHWYPKDGTEAQPFETNNMITFRRMPDGSLKVWQVIYNLIE